MQCACTNSLDRPSLSKLAGVISSSPITVQPPDSRVSRVTLYAGALVGKLLPSLQMKIEIKGTVRDDAHSSQENLSSLNSNSITGFVT